MTCGVECSAVVAFEEGLESGVEGAELEDFAEIDRLNQALADGGGEPEVAEGGEIGDGEFGGGADEGEIDRDETFFRRVVGERSTFPGLELLK